MEYFRTARTVSDYKRFRPAYFGRIGELIRAHVPNLEVAEALDVGCGFGNSTAILTRFARGVTGLDASPAMLAAATPAPDIRYLEGHVEESGLFASGTFGLITASSAWHWFDQRKALDNFQRWSTPGAILVLYNHWFTLQMVDDPGFADHLTEAHYRHYPAPPRNIRNPVEVGDEPGWETVVVTHFDDPHEYGLEAFCHYIMSQSNVTIITEQDPDAYRPIHATLEESLRASFNGETRTLMFRGKVEIYRKR